MTVPDSDSIANYGGIMSNYLGIPAVDPTTDLDASNFNTMSASCAAMTRTALHAEVAFMGSATTPTYVSHETSWKSNTTAAPTIVRTGTGVYTVTFLTSVLDELSISHTLNLRRSFGQAEGSVAYIVQCSASANVITVRTFTPSTGVAVDPAGVTIVCWTR